MSWSPCAPRTGLANDEAQADSRTAAAVVTTTLMLILVIVIFVSAALTDLLSRI